MEGGCAEGGPAEPSAEALKKRTQRARRAYERRDYLRKVAAVQRLCRRLEAGGTVADACREPTMPPRATLMYWLAHEAELRAMFEAATARAAEVFGPRRAYVGFDEAVAAELLERLAHGRSLAEVCEERDMPTPVTVHRWRTERPAFDAAYLQAREAQAERLFDLAWRIACEAEEHEVKTARLKIQAIRHRIAKLAPRVFGTQKAQAADGGTGSGAGAGRKTTWFVARRFGQTPDGRLLEITDLVEGLPQAEIEALKADIRAGRKTAETLPPTADWLPYRERLQPR
ncbi:hypothetical protein [Phenylobacterium sp.]|uniref:terminase small subunit-like protein n=1 Tax=Phenylobacterium sp. TaxID=1871053 RepID=UPI0025E9B881|nr:hypothetical protein [Phenylobacterium sp.]MBX3482250.1 hypothetical protein [Phenylobacterium sp.]